MSELQAILMAPEWHHQVSEGMKVSTVRKGLRDYKTGKTMLCCPIKSWCVEVNVTSVDKTYMGNVPNEVAVSEGFVDRYDLFEKMKEYYPDMKLTDDVTIVTWEK